MAKKKLLGCLSTLITIIVSMKLVVFQFALWDDWRHIPHFHLMRYRNYMKNISYEDIEKYVKNGECQTSTDVLHKLIDDGVLDSSVPLYGYGWKSRINLRGEKYDHPVSLFDGEENIWTLLVSGYEEAPNDMIVAATRNVDLTRLCPEDPDFHEIFVFPQEDPIPILRDFAYVITKDGSSPIIQKRTRRSTGESYWSTGHKVLWNTRTTNPTNGLTKWKYLYPNER